jgi:AraC-like DNA-binding protein
MQNISALPDLMNDSQRQQTELILAKSNIALISCNFWWMTIKEIIPCRRLADSYLYVPKIGRLKCRVGNEERTIGPGEFMMVAEGVEHEAYMADDCDYFEVFSLHAHAYTHQNLPLFAVFSSSFGKLDYPEMWIAQLSLLTHLMGKSLELGRSYGEPWLRSFLLHQVMQNNPVRDIPIADDPRMWRAVYTIINNFTESVTVEKLAQDANISTVQFRKLFRRYTGISPKDYLIQTRLRKAMALLQSNPQLTIKEVAEQTGFGNSHYLHIAFKTAYGITPGECRKSIRSDSRL